MNLWQRKNLVVCCLLGLALTLSAQAQRYSVGTPVGTPDIILPANGSGVGAGLAITLKCRPLTDYDYDNWTCSTVEDGATITWTAKDAYGNDVGEFTDNLGPIAEWIAPESVGTVTITATADDNPYYLADDPPQQHSHTVNVVNRVYVKPGAVGANSGGSWYDAFTHLQDALAVAGAGTEVWVAEGTYYPGTTQSATFTIAGEAVYGGFAGTETTNNPTGGTSTLSGDINGGGLDAGNCQQVVSMSGGTLDGFTITMGYNDASGDGGGLGCNSGSPTVNNCTFTSNYAANDGGAVFVNGSSPTFSDCTFSSNEAGNDGGAVRCDGGSPTFSDCPFSSNEAGDDGGAVRCDGSSPTFSHCTFSDNDAGDHGGAVFYTNSSGSFINTCTFSDNNSVDTGGAVTLQGGSNPTFDTCTFTGNATEGRGVFWPIYSEGMGGAINIEGSSPTLNNCTISGNTAYRHGGGIRITGSGCNVTITGGSVTGNTALCHDGGGIEVQGGAQVTIDDLTITYNHADFNGVDDNPDVPPGVTDTRRGDGGGICIEGAGTNVTIDDSTIQYNTCDNQGGGCRQKNQGDWDADGFTRNHCLYNLHSPYRVPEDYDNIWD